LARQEKNNHRLPRRDQFPADIETTLYDVLATLRWQEQLIRHAIQQAERRKRDRGKRSAKGGKRAKKTPITRRTSKRTHRK